ncbi:MAG: hypothetical protein CL494_07645 [Actinobacteria bacterium]|nr:hypothetical protein [Actinomycetota bacterium]
MSSAWPAPPLLIAQEVGHTIGDDGTALPTVVIDVSEHPEIADLPRVHAIDGIGDVATAAVKTGDAVVLGVRLSRPVTAAFAVVFDLRLHEEFLLDVAVAQTLTFATTIPERAKDDYPLWLAVDINEGALRAVITGS